MTSVPEPDLTAVCDVCVQPIADGEGHVWVDTDAADQAARAARQLDARGDAGELLSGTDLFADTDAPWHTTHTTCLQPLAWAYTIEVERIRTWPAYLHWTAHLMGKGWIDGTNWQDLVLRSLEPPHTTVTGLRPVRPQSLDFRGIGN